jgi:hypothetical protein
LTIARAVKEDFEWASANCSVITRKLLEIFRVPDSAKLLKPHFNNETKQLFGYMPSSYTIEDYVPNKSALEVAICCGFFE